jgi:hypothetical protein
VRLFFCFHFMNTLHKRLFGVAGLLVPAAIAAYWYWSPYLAMHQMRNAVASADAGSFNEHVDYPKLRESLKGQFSARITGGLSARPHSDNAIANAGAALGSMLGLALVDKMVDAVVRPETVMQAMKNGTLRTREQAPESKDTAPGGADPQARKVDWHTERQGADQMLVYVNSAAQDKRETAFVLHRDGFANWKLTEIRLPD